MNSKLLNILIDSFPKILLKGIEITIPLTVISFAFAMVIAVFTALVQYAKVPVLRQIARFYVWVIRGTPLLAQLFVVFYALPSLGVNLDPFPTAILVFSINEGAYCAETIRGSLDAVPAGQLEAGYCVGMSYIQIVFRILLPQAMRSAFPALSNSLISLVKDTSLAYNITIAEMFTEAKRIAAKNYQTLAMYCEVAVVYLIFCTLLTFLQRFIEKQFAKRGFTKE